MFCEVLKSKAFSFQKAVGNIKAFLLWTSSADVLNAMSGDILHVMGRDVLHVMSGDILYVMGRDILHVMSGDVLQNVPTHRK